MSVNVLLLGGNGFLGKGLQDELRERNVKFRSIDIDEIDLSTPDSVQSLTDILKDFTHVVMLAAKIGREIFETDPDTNADYNKRIFMNVVSAMDLASDRFKKKFDVTYYSSSEVYGSMKSRNDIITTNTPPNVNQIGRGKYAYEKLHAENYLRKMYNSNQVIENLKIIRPFNVSGRYQQRGVLFDMVKSLKTKNEIWFSDDTTRTLTSADYAKRVGVDIILSNKSTLVNLSENVSMDMHDLACMVVCALNSDVDFLMRKPVDKSIQYRQTSIVPENVTVDQIKFVKRLIGELDV